ncbi:PHP domain-containing protein [Clostridium perfringens]|uniref:TrlF family AAA-like ATPase n=2 Tax=Clostridium perfringens TaxID=1502 RepID=UPI00285D57D3|nr:PHP domain-containing protein [Clostridium perfringens]ELC8347727.1 PHP domain-containing protein [Clostridium perfringens]ELC8439289.1 PHP domain-containing protein [Clostridium perfringens]
MINLISRGSEWAKWDLHLHSKYSMESRTKMEVEEIFRKAVEKEIKMISITDHSNVDALDEIWEIYENGECEKGPYKELIDFIPGIELKTDKGQHGVHIISIFPKEVYIEKSKREKKLTKSFLYDNFCAKLDLTKSKIEENGGGDYSKGLLNSAVKFEQAVDLTHELGGLVIIHGGDKHGSIEEEISNPKGYTPEELYKALDITKTDIVSNKIDIIEIPNFNKRQAKNAKFYKNYFNKPCIIGSDAHERGEYEKLGYKCTWVKANTTFNGLKQALIDYENRIDLNELPEQINRVNKNPTKFIDKLNITWNENYDGKKGEWFKEISIPLNTGLVSIIGNKGNGKSAIAEIISLVSDSKKNEKFSFLNNKKFLKNKLASNFVGQVIWKSEDSSEKKNLTYKPEESAIEKVQCIPQQYFEEICTDTELEKFTREINGVIFSRLSLEEKEGEKTLENLILKYTNSIENNINYFKVNLSRVNQEIVYLESKLKNSYNEQQKKLLEECQLKINAHEKIRPNQIERPKLSQEKQKKYDELINKIEKIKLLINDKETEKLAVNVKIKNLNLIKEKLKSINERFTNERVNLSEELKEFNLNIDEIIQITLNFQSIEKEIDKYVSKECILSKELISNKKIVEDLDKEKDSITLEENENIKAYDKFLKENEDWQYRNKLYMEEKEKIQKEIEYIKTEINNDLKDLFEKRRKITEEIFKEKEKIVNIYNRFKRPIDKFLEENSSIQNGYNIAIRSGLIIKDNFEEILFNYINKQKRNVFREDQYTLSKTIPRFEDLEDEKEYVEIPNLILETMRGYDTPISEQVKSERVVDFYNYIYGLDYITNRYELISDNKTLDKLSPGERGALLLIFYLLLDMSDIPLVIDQPEDNLDNQSVAKVLVPFIQEAKKRRQILMVTHNPNLAVVADSDQIIHMKIDKENNNKVIVESAAIEDIKMNERVVTILEGTMNSFKKREEKYIK